MSIFFVVELFLRHGSLFFFVVLFLVVLFLLMVLSLLGDLWFVLGGLVVFLFMVVI